MRLKRILSFALLFVLAGSYALAENCLTTGDMDPATKNAIETAAKQFYGFTAAGDFASLRNAAIPSLQGSFGTIERAVADNRDVFASQPANIYSTYVLDATGGAPTLDNAYFVCGVYNSPTRLQFTIPNLPAAKYALVIFDVSNSAKGPYWLSLILQEMSGYWKLAGFYPKPRRIGNNGAGWFLTQARDYRAKGELHNAYFYYVTARDLALPVSFMLTRPVEKLDAEAQPIVPKDIPGDQPMTLAGANGQNFEVTQMFPVPVGTGMNLVVKYKALADVSDARTSFANNMALIKALTTKYPEYKDAFAGVVARAVGPSGADYGTVMAMNDIK
ncbi:MAG TPA: hypothetical protein VL382_09665 [Terriglobales bacterium]|nr:hypothetical protein [Terriglobales bacterium]